MDIAADNPVRTPGPVLAAERERQGLSRAEMASRLRISTTQVEAMENDDYGRLPRGTFLRGFVRNYAKALGLDAAELVAELDRAQPRASAPGIVVPTQNIRFDPLGQRFAGPWVKAAMVAATVVVLAFAALYWWFFMRPGTSAATVVKKPAIEASQPVATLQPEPVRAIPQPEVAPDAAPPSPPLVAEPAPEAGRVEVAQPSILPSVPAGNPAVAKPAATLSATAASEPPPPGSKSLRFAFSGASWVEIKDARGRTLISKVNPKGIDAEVVGKPPFTVWIGNAPEVKMSYEGKEFDLAPHTRAAVARFTLD